MGKGVGGDATRPYYAEVDSDIDIPEEELAAAFEAEADSSTDELDNLVVTNTAPLVGTPVNRVFKTFTSNTPIIEGLSMIRHLGGDKYEFVNLNDVNIRDISSEEVGEKISHAPQSSNLWKKCKEDWEAITLKVGQAVGSSGKIYDIHPIQERRRPDSYSYPQRRLYSASKICHSSSDAESTSLPSYHPIHLVKERKHPKIWLLVCSARVASFIKKPWNTSTKTSSSSTISAR